MSSHFHAIVWIDHHEAKVFHFNADAADKVTIHPHHASRQVHRKANSIGSGHASEDQAYYHAVAEAIGDAGAILVTGPANAKNELVKHIKHHDKHMVDRIVGVEALDHPSDGQLLAHARHYFRAADWMIGATPA